jgi:hypothetical protein
MVRGLALALGVVVAVVVSAYLSFEAGRIQADYNIIESAADRRNYENRIEDMEEQIVALKEEAVADGAARSFSTRCAGCVVTTSAARSSTRSGRTTEH